MHYRICPTSVFLYVEQKNAYCLVNKVMCTHANGNGMLHNVEVSDQNWKPKRPDIYHWKHQIRWTSDLRPKNKRYPPVPGEVHYFKSDQSSFCDLYIAFRLVVAIVLAISASTLVVPRNPKIRRTLSNPSSIRFLENLKLLGYVNRFPSLLL